MNDAKKCDTCAHSAAMLATVGQCSGTLDAAGNCTSHAPRPVPGDVEAARAADARRKAGKP